MPMPDILDVPGWTYYIHVDIAAIIYNKQSRGVKALLDKIADNGHTKLDNIPGITWSFGCMFPSKTSRFRDTRLLKIGNAPNDSRMTLRTLLSQIYDGRMVSASDSQPQDRGFESR